MSELPAAIKDPESAVAWAEYVRGRVTPMDTTSIVTPDDVIADLRNLKAAAGRMALVVKEAEALRRDAGRALAKARARAMGDVMSGTVQEKAARVDQKVEAEEDAYAVADSAYEYARSIARLVEGQKSAVQTIARLVELTYSLAGRAS